MKEPLSLGMLAAAALTNLGGTIERFGEDFVGTNPFADPGIDFLKYVRYRHHRKGHRGHFEKSLARRRRRNQLRRETRRLQRLAA